MCVLHIPTTTELIIFYRRKLCKLLPEQYTIEGDKIHPLRTAVFNCAMCVKSTLYGKVHCLCDTCGRLVIY